MTGPAQAAVRIRDRLAASGGGAAAARLTHVLESIGWRVGDSASPEDVAQEILPALSACAREQSDVGALYRQIAEVLRGSGPLLDGGLPDTSAYLPAAEEIVRRFIAGDG